jgi:ABC-2 type transport system permease protein
MFELFFAEFKLSWIEFRRYPLESLAVVFITTIFFYALFLSTRYIAGPSLQFGDKLDAIIVGYVLWSLVSFVLNRIAFDLQKEAQTGTLEQLFLSSFGATTVVLVRSLANLALQLIVTLGILLIIIGLTGSSLNFPTALILPLISVLMSAYGISLMVGALALIFKRIQQILAFFQFGLLFILATPIDSFTGINLLLVKLLPMTTGAELLRDLMARGNNLDMAKLTFAFGCGAFYLGMGLFIFNLSEKAAKSRGIISGY